MSSSKKEAKAAAALAASMQHSMDLDGGEKKTPNLVAEDLDDYELPHLKPSEMFCDFLESEMVQRPGMVMIFYNINSLGSSSVFGGARTNIVDPRRIPMFLHKYKNVIRSHAVNRLATHFKDTHVSAGVTETLTADDYSISFSFASLTEAGRELNAHGKNELPIDFATYFNWVAPQAPNPGQQPVYVVNVFVQLQDAGKRSGPVLKRHREEEVSKNDPAKKSRPNAGSYSSYNREQRERQEQEKLEAVRQASLLTAKAIYEDKANDLKRMAPLAANNWPDLKETEGPIWPNKGKISMPME